jgi:NAD+ kinase
MLLSVRVIREGRQVAEAVAFNEVVVHRSNSSSMIECEVRIDGDYLYTQRADGLIVSTPTGSTAYALSAGGPIVHPALDVITLVPVCPHTLSNRPIVVSGDAKVEIRMHRPGDVCARFDSHSHFDLHLNDRLIIEKCPQSVCLLHPDGHSYYHTLREKLLWNKTL